MINGVTTDLPIGDALACAEMLVALRRAVPPDKWVESAPGSVADIPEGLF